MSQPTATQTALASATMDDTTSAFHHMNFDEPVRRRKRGRRGGSKPANPSAAGLAQVARFNSLLARPQSPLVFDIPALTPDAAASDAYTDQIRLQIASIRKQMSNVEGPSVRFGNNCASSNASYAEPNSKDAPVHLSPRLAARSLSRFESYYTVLQLPPPLPRPTTLPPTSLPPTPEVWSSSAELSQTLSVR